MLIKYKRPFNRIYRQDQNKDKQVNEVREAGELSDSCYFKPAFPFSFTIDSDLRNSSPYLLSLSYLHTVAAPF